jgi:ankyrin repeat protein
MTALMIAAERGDVEVFRTLLDSNSDIDAKDNVSCNHQLQYNIHRSDE